jgi:hypothetical protein
MSKRQWLCILGVWVMLFLFLGLKATWHKPVALITGIIIIAIAYNIPQEIGKDRSSDNSTFVESNNKDK